MKNPTRKGVGIIGCGNISQAYFKGVDSFDNVKVIACADINESAAKAKAEEFKVEALSVEALLARKDIEIVVNLTTPQHHVSVNKAILAAGKHAHCEKPFGLDLKGGQEVLDLARAKNLRVSSAPDTFLGAGHQTCRKWIDDGWIGTPLAGTAFMMCPGHESWHPSPEFYYLKGGGPMLDMGPYYVTALVNLLGPAKRVVAMTTRSWKERTITSEPKKGTKMKVEVDTHQAGVIQFESGALISMVMSFDVRKHAHHPIEIYGTEGSLKCPDPNTFGGEPAFSKGRGVDWTAIPLSHPHDKNSRGIGVADLALAVDQGRLPRCDGSLAQHVLEVMLAFETSSHEGRPVDITTKTQQPPALPLETREGHLIG